MIPPELTAKMVAIGKLLATQDNRCTAHPLYIVQEKHRVYGFDPSYSDDIVWIDTYNDGIEADAEEHARLEAAWDETCNEPDGWTRTAYQDEWRFVTAALTEQTCRDYIDGNKHRHRGDLRIYAESAYRNREWQDVREYLIALAAEHGGDK